MRKALHSFFIIWTFATACASKQTTQKAQVVESAPTKSYQYSAMTPEERPYIMLPSFCLNTATALIAWSAQPPSMITMKLFNRWGNEVALINDPHMVPAEFFSAPPANLADGSILFYTMTYAQLNGENITITGSINYMGETCSN